jgi:hypothetical protein
MAPHVSPALEIEPLSRGVPEKLQQFASTWSPPLSADSWRCHTLSIQGLGWRDVAGDIVIPGLGFIAVTGSGSITVEVYAPCDIDIHIRKSWIEATPQPVKWQ